MLDQFASQAVVVVLNRLIERETWAREKLAPFAGKVARIEALPFAVTLAIDSDGCFTTAAGSASSDPAVHIAIDPGQLPNLLVEPQAVLRNVRLTGDAEFAQALSQVLQNLRPEPEEELSRWIGDAAAVRVVGLLRTALAQAKEGGERLARTTADYFVAEDPMLVDRETGEVFARDVIALRDDAERLAKRIELIERNQRENRERVSGNTREPRSTP